MMTKIGEHHTILPIHQNFLPPLDSLTLREIRSPTGKGVLQIRFTTFRAGLGEDRGQSGHGKVSGIEQSGHFPIDRNDGMPPPLELETTALGILLKTVDPEVIPSATPTDSTVVQGASGKASRLGSSPLRAKHIHLQERFAEDE